MGHRGHIVGLYVYPVKGLSPQSLEGVEVRRQQGFRGDREFALARPDGDYRADSGKAFPKTEFFMLARNERLAGLRTHLELATKRFTVSVGGHAVHQSSWAESDGRDHSARFFARVLDLPAGQVPVVAHEADRRFTDVSVVSDVMMQAISIINLASVRALEERIERSIDPLRFRANVYVDGWPAFAELDLLDPARGRPLEIRLGSARLEPVLNTGRCAATEVNPVNARRDLEVPRLIFENYGHSEMGVYGEAVTDGVLAVGDRADLAEEHDRVRVG